VSRSASTRTSGSTLGKHADPGHHSTASQRNTPRDPLELII